jgi:hypothetical protein
LVDEAERTWKSMLRERSKHLSSGAAIVVRKRIFVLHPALCRPRRGSLFYATLSSASPTPQARIGLAGDPGRAKRPLFRACGAGLSACATKAIRSSRKKNICNTEERKKELFADLLHLRLLCSSVLEAHPKISG